MTLPELLQHSNVQHGEVIGDYAVITYRALSNGACQFCRRAYSTGRQIVGLHASWLDEFEPEVSCLVCSKGCAYAQILVGVPAAEGL